MKSTKKITCYLFLVSITTSFLIWFCKSDIFTQIQMFLLRISVFTVFRGNRDFIVNLLLGISTSAWFATFGFYIEYKEKKRHVQDELQKTYLTIRNRCFSRIFYERNSYDHDYDEVASIYNYLKEKKSLIFDYRPVSLIIKIKIHKLMNRIKNTSGEKKTLTQSLLSKDISLFEYMAEDKYALICSILGDLYSYFTVIDMYQVPIKDCTRLIKLYEDKMQKTAETDIRYKMYENMIKLQKQHLLVLERKLLSRYPFNTTEYQTFVNKKNLLAKFYAIDDKFSNAMSTYVVEILEPKDAIIEDDDTLYSPNDERLEG